MINSNVRTLEMRLLFFDAVLLIKSELAVAEYQINY